MTDRTILSDGVCITAHLRTDRPGVLISAFVADAGYLSAGFALDPAAARALAARLNALAARWPLG